MENIGFNQKLFEVKEVKVEDDSAYYSLLFIKRWKIIPVILN